MPKPRNPTSGGHLIGRVIGQKYEITKLLGKGAMGHVYAAKHATLERTVAIKVVHVEATSDPLLVGRFKSEARAASRLDHPNSVQILDFGEEDEGRLLYIVMELLKGQDLEQVLKRVGTMAETRAVNIMSQTLLALVAAHQNSIVHRDLKPANIMLVKDPRDGSETVKVCDFGIAKLQDPLGSEDPTGMLTLTKAGAVVGTPSYMSPEQAAGKRVDARTDIFSCGVILYRMVTGKKPFKSDTLMGLLSQVMATEPTPVPQLASTVDGRLVDVIQRAMQKDPNARYQSARDMMSALDEIRASPDRTVHHSATLSGHQSTRAIGRPLTPTRAFAANQTEAPRMMQSMTSAPSGTWAPSGTYTLPEAPRIRSPLIPIAAAVTLVVGIGLGASTLSPDSGDTSKLMAMVAEGSYGSAESYGLEHFETFSVDESAVDFMREAMRLRRETGGFPNDFPIQFDPSAVITPGTWRGMLTKTRLRQKHSFSLHLREIRGGVAHGTIDWPEVGLTAEIEGYFHGNQFILWDTSVDGSERYRKAYILFEKKSFMISPNGRLYGYEGPVRDILDGQRVQ